MSLDVVTLLVMSVFVQSRPAEPAEPPEPQPLKIGDTPPPLHVSAWIPSRPPVLPGAQLDGHECIFVMHFWSSTDPASRRSMQYLAQMYHEMARHRVMVIALSNEDAEFLAQVAERAKLPYWVAADSDNQTTETWLAEVEPFPWTFVLDRSGRIVWAGNSMSDLQEVVAGLTAGTYDLTVARKRMETEARIAQMMDVCHDLIRAGDAKGAIRTADKMIEIDPGRLESYRYKRTLITRRLRHTAALPAFWESARKSLWDRPAGLHELLVWQWDDEALKERDPALMLRCAERMVELTKREDPFALIALARVQHELGRHDAAIENQAKAVEVLKLDPEDEAATMLEYYRRIKAAAEGAASSAPASRPAS